MATKKGIIATIVILAAISAASFMIWIIPQNRGPTFVISDYRSELDGVRARQSVIAIEMDSDLKGLLNNTMSPDDFTGRAQTSSSQVTSLISELIESNPPAEWKPSYLNYAESLKKYNDYLIESISLANKMRSGLSSTDLNGEISKMDSLKKDSDLLATKSNETSP